MTAPKRYRTIVADPPWPYERFVSHNRTAGKWSREVIKPLPYKPMAVDEIAAVPVNDWADPAGCRLFLWTTNRWLPHAFGLLNGWGLEYRQTLVWHKVNGSPFLGSVAPNHAEFLLVATRGTAGRKEEAFPSSVMSFRHNAKVHSRKPEGFLDHIERVSYGPYLELFARRARFGWDYWGDESLSTAELAGAGS